jgi:hypothetical protein
MTLEMYEFIKDIRDNNEHLSNVSFMKLLEKDFGIDEETWIEFMDMERSKSKRS